MNEKFFEVKNLSFSHYKSPCCLVNISFSIEKNSKTLILASKDMGKTTLLSVLSSFKDKYTGEIFFNGKELKQVSDLEKNFSFLPTEPIFFERKTVFKNINYLCKNHGLNLLEKEDLENHLSKINLSKIVCKKISKLSLVEKKKLAIFRSLLKKPNIIFLDDQFENLESDNINEFETIFNEYEKLLKSNNTLIFSLSENSYKNCKNSLKNLKIDKILYLFDTKIAKFENLNEFENKIINFNQFLFLDNKFYLMGNILKEDSKFYFVNDDVIKFEFDNEFYQKLNELKLEETDYEECTICCDYQIKFEELDNKKFNDLLKNIQIAIFSRLDGERII